jgi:UDP-glucose 4-epimerase
MNLEDREAMAKLFEDYQFDSVINLAAQAGVRYSIENPLAYIDTNLVGFAHIYSHLYDLSTICLRFLSFTIRMIEQM